MLLLPLVSLVQFKDTCAVEIISMSLDFVEAPVLSDSLQTKQTLDIYAVYDTDFVTYKIEMTFEFTVGVGFICTVGCDADIVPSATINEVVPKFKVPEIECMNLLNYFTMILLLWKFGILSDYEK